MGVMNHNAIIATTWNEDEFIRVWGWCEEQWESLPEIAHLFIQGPLTVNGYRSIIVVPDGSKEGWEHSDTANNIRDDFIATLQDGDYEDGSSPWDWVEVGFGEFGQMVLRGNCGNMYNDRVYATLALNESLHL